MNDDNVINMGGNQFMKNNKGHLIPLDKVKPLDKLRDEVVREMFADAVALQAEMVLKKNRFFENFEQFCEVSAAEYDKTWGGEKGNTTLQSYDGMMKITLQVNERHVFDEKLQVAKRLIDECVQDWSADANDNVKALVNHAFQVDKAGKISTGRVLSLKQLNITDDKWLKAMQAISDSMQVDDTTQYMRFHEKNDEGKWQGVSLDFANL